jgi:Trypsin-co-occurring domain 1
MATLVPVTFPDGITIYVESTESAALPGEPTIQEASAADAAAKALETAQQLSDSVKMFCARVIGSLRELAPNRQPAKATVEFGLNISLEGNVYLVKSSGEASIKITAEWQLNAKE